jgi:hypothetical protein
MPPLGKSRYLKRKKVLEDDRSSWLSHWSDLADHIMPRRIRLNTSQRNKGTKKNDKIYNNTATRALRILGSGMMAGITSPSRPWFNLTTPDPGIAEKAAVKQWLGDVRLRMLEVFARSNVYNSLAQLYEDLGGFGVCPMLVEEDSIDVIRTSIMPIGSYSLQLDERMRVSTVYRDTTFTVEQLYNRFGKDNCSTHVVRMYEAGNLDTVIDVIHVIELNDDREPGIKTREGMKYRSVWFEAKSSEDKLLGWGGFEEFPVMAPRWKVTGEDVYGNCPGMDALPDIRSLMKIERRSMQAVDKMINPPMKAPTSLRTNRVSLLPGDVTYVDSTAGNATFEPAVVVHPQTVKVAQEKAERVEWRINSTFYADLFLMLANSAVPGMTAREVQERHEEKMLQLGPVLERLQDELLGPLIDRTFAIMMRNGLLPEPPEELQGVDLKVEYISILAEAQKLIWTVAVERLASFVTQLANVQPDILDKIDWDQMVDKYAELLGAPPELVRADDMVEQVRRNRAEQEAQQQQMAEQASAFKDAAQGAQALGQTDMTNDNALQRMMQAVGSSLPAAA